MEIKTDYAPDSQCLRMCEELNGYFGRLGIKKRIEVMRLSPRKISVLWRWLDADGKPEPNTTTIEQFGTWKDVKTYLRGMSKMINAVSSHLRTSK